MHAQSANIWQPLRSKELSCTLYVQRPISASQHRHPQSINTFSYSPSKGQLEFKLGDTGQTLGILTLLSSANPCLCELVCSAAGGSRFLLTVEITL